VVDEIVMRAKEVGI